MCRYFLLAMVLLVGIETSVMAQLPPTEMLKGEEIFTFKEDINLPTLGIENQAHSGTCWSFGITAVIESDIIAKGGKATNLSDMWVVRHAYYDKVVKYVRMHGYLNLSVGGAMHDVTDIIKRYGIVPEKLYTGLNYGTKYHDFAELDAVLKSYADAVIEGGKPTVVWKRGLNMILDNYFGERVASFKWDGSADSYTPKGYAESLGLDMDDYISLTSFSHHPYEEWFALEVPDNWMWRESYNIPIKELMGVMDRLLESGYTFGLAIDVTEPGFKTFNGVAIVPITEEQEDEKGKKWEYLERRRQQEFDNYTTTDDHCIQIIGRAHNREGEIFYKAKNSWGKIEPYDGVIYLSKSYLELKTLSLMVNGNHLPADLKRRVGSK